MTKQDEKIKKVQVVVDKNVVETSFEKWAKPGQFSRTLSKGPKTTNWIWRNSSFLVKTPNWIWSIALKYSKSESPTYAKYVKSLNAKQS